MLSACDRLDVAINHREIDSYTQAMLCGAKAVYGMRCAERK